MPLFRRCCSRWSLKSGALAVASYSIMESIVCTGLVLTRHLSMKDSTKIMAEYEMITYSSLATFAVLTMFTFLLVVGIMKDMLILMMPWLIQRVIISFYFTICAASLVYLQIYYVKAVVALDTVLSSLFIFSAVFGVYTMLVVLSYYERIRDGKQRRQRIHMRSVIRDVIGAIDNITPEDGESPLSDSDHDILAAALNPTLAPPDYEEEPPPYEESDPNPQPITSEETRLGETDSLPGYTETVEGQATDRAASEDEESSIVPSEPFSISRAVFDRRFVTTDLSNSLYVSRDPSYVALPINAMS